MTDTQNDSQQHVAAISKERIAILAVSVVAVLAVGYFYLSSKAASSRARDVELALSQASENNEALAAELQKSKQMRLEEESVITTIIEEHLASLLRMEASLDEYGKEFDKWQTTVGALENDELGRRVASDPELVEQYLALQSEYKPDPLFADLKQSEIDNLRIPLEKAAASPIKANRPGAGLEHRILTTQEGIEKALLRIRSRNAQFDAIISRAPSRVLDSTPLLPDAVKNLENALSDAQNERIAEEVRKIREEFDAKLTTEKAATERIKRQKELDQQEYERRLAELEQKTSQGQLNENLQAVTDKKKEEAARRALERAYQHDLPEIKSLLKPFITDGRTQPDKTRFELSADVGPVSLGKLQGAQVLHRTPDAQRLLWSMTTANRTNDRDLGAFPAYFGGEQDWRNKQPAVARAQELLIKYGELMVEKEMLAP
jgi:hypothetical protein